VDDSVNSFKEKLDASHKWPALYTFKFICLNEKTIHIKQLFVNHEVKEKASSKGKYISLTVSIMARNSDEIIEYYQEVYKIGDIISL